MKNKHKQIRELPVIGGVYRHFKHTEALEYMFKVLNIAIHSETDELYVVYESLQPNDRLKKAGTNVSIRPLSMFMEEVDKPEYQYKGPRFILEPENKYGYF